MQAVVRIHALALNGLRQAVRDQVLYVLAGFCAILILGSLVISQLTIGERARIVTDLGLSATAILATLLAIVVSINQAARDAERRTLDTILAKPVARWEVLAGRFAGMSVTLALLVVAMGLLHSVVLLSVGGFDWAMWKALLLTWVEVTLVAALAIFFSTFTTMVPSMFISLGFVVIGHTSWGLRLMADHLSSPSARALMLGLWAVLPNLEILNIRSEVVWHATVPWSVIGLACAYGLSYSGLLIVLGAAVLSRRDLA